MVNIRLMTKDDLSSVASIERNIFSIPWSEKAFEDSLKNDNTIYVVTEKDGDIAGYCGIYISFNEGNITNVAVLPECRRQGIAENMLMYILALAKEKGITDIILEVRETNVSAIALYEKIGFKEAGIRKNFYQKPTENALIMWKHNL